MNYMNYINYVDELIYGKDLMDSPEVEFFKNKNLAPYIKTDEKDYNIMKALKVTFNHDFKEKYNKDIFQDWDDHKFRMLIKYLYPFLDFEQHIEYHLKLKYDIKE